MYKRQRRGRHVVFLNNDTIPLAGWLAPLIAELDADPTVAVVGSKLLFPDETIQHAGVVFSRDLPIPYHLFAHAPGTFAAVNHRRELQCVTGACMAVRRAVFDAVGGFDEGYRNGYEDVDFCLQVRQRGGRIVYQPASVLYHLESQTAGRKTNDEANGRRLMERWGAQWHRLGDEDVVLAAEGWCSRSPDGSDRKVLTQITDPAERALWEHVATLQQALRSDDTAAARQLLAGGTAWPADASVQRWLDRVARLLGIAADHGATAAQA